MKKLTLLPLLALLFMQACKKDDTADEQPEAKPVDYFYPMKVGSYWIYETLNTQNSDVALDTIKVLGDTSVNGRTYYRFNKLSFDNYIVPEAEYLLADSSGFIVDPSGFIYDINTGIKDTVSYDSGPSYDMVIRTGNRDTLVSVPAGNFHTLETIMDMYYTNMAPPVGINPRHSYYYTAKGVGSVKMSYFYAASTGEFIVTLKSYHIEP